MGGKARQIIDNSMDEVGGWFGGGSGGGVISI